MRMIVSRQFELLKWMREEIVFGKYSHLFNKNRLKLQIFNEVFPENDYKINSRVITLGTNSQFGIMNSRWWSILFGQFTLCCNALLSFITSPFPHIRCSDLFVITVKFEKVLLLMTIHKMDFHFSLKCVSIFIFTFSLCLFNDNNTKCYSNRYGDCSE